MNHTPLVSRAGEEIFAMLPGGTIRVDEFCADIETLAAALPDVRYIANLVSDRYVFTVVFFAAISRGQTVLLPAQRDINVRAQLTDFDSIHILQDDDAVIRRFTPGENGVATSPACSSDHTAAVVFTSGSTGLPQACTKTWGLLDSFRRQHSQVLTNTNSTVAAILATVPSWHMYGLEWALLLPTIAPLTLYCAADFYPRDVAIGLNALASPLLVTTPVHLRALRADPRALAGMHRVMSATAPLDQQQAAQIESSYAAYLLEIYGCSEVGTVAYRRTAHTDVWTMFDAFDPSWNGDELSLSHAHLDASVTLADAFTKIDEQRFLLQGRRGDIVKVAGKRDSLARLNAELLNIPGIEDGVIFQPKQRDKTGRDRLAGFVVAPDLSIFEVRQRLRRHLPAAFMPRPFVKVDSLPRDKTGKLKASALDKLLSSVSHE